jgi:PPOX class probable F420-dependent enzyme
MPPQVEAAGLRAGRRQAGCRPLRYPPLPRRTPRIRAGEARRRFAAARVARLATADATGRPHLVPFVFALDGDTVYSAVDHKPKRTTALRRLANIAENPAVAVLADHYDDAEWANLWWVRGDGTGRLVQPRSEEERRAVALLQDRYAPYVERPPSGPVLAVEIRWWSGWAADR